MNYFGLCNVLSTDLCAFTCCSFGFEYFPPVCILYENSSTSSILFLATMLRESIRLEKRTYVVGGKK